MLLDIAERGRYLGLVLFSAQQFRSQVHRRVVGNSATAVYGRMDADELATPGYSVLSPAIKTKLATLDKGQLMVRHPHFAQPIFVRFPRPSMLTGREGAQAFSAAGRDAVRRGYFALASNWIRHSPWRRSTTCSGCMRISMWYGLATRRCRRPKDVRTFFRSQFESPHCCAARKGGVPTSVAPDARWRSVRRMRTLLARGAALTLCAVGMIVPGRDRGAGSLAGSFEVASAVARHAPDAD